MTFPPIDHADLVAHGLPPAAPLGLDGSTLRCGADVPKFARRLLLAAMASPPPEGDRLAYLRHVRDLLIELTDYTQAADSTLPAADRAAWAAYRAALRDLPANYIGTGPIQWPAIPTPAADAVPPVISARQARLWLVRHGIDLAAVDAAIASVPDAVTRESVRVEWEYGTEVHRDSQWLAALGPALDLDAATLDAAFREAAGL